MGEAPEKDPYEILGVSPLATQEEIRRAYRALVRRYHPDSGTDEASATRFLEVHQAYELLTDPARRRAYDRLHRERRERKTTSFWWEVVLSRQVLPALPEEQTLYVLVEIYPTKRVPSRRVPLNLVLVIDRSTSMQGDRLDYVKSAAHHIIEELDSQDVLGIVAFDDRAETIVPSQPLTNRDYIHSRVSSIWASGGTEILRGLLAGLKQIRRFHNQDRISHLLLLTDGHTYGDEKACLAEARQAGKEGIGISAFGIGEDWHEMFLSALTRETGGACVYISDPPQARRALRETIRGLCDISVRDLWLIPRFPKQVRLESAFRCNPDVERLRLVGEEISLGALSVDTHLSILLELAVAPMPPGRYRLMQLELRGMLPDAGREDRLLVDLEIEIKEEVEEQPISTAIITAVNKVNLFRMQERAWQALEEGRREEARQQLEAVATRLLDLGETSLAHVALLEARRLAEGEEVSKQAKKEIFFGTRRLRLREREG
ncbi:MAG TPA: DnaJ domain-containing protein [Thermoflexia bacterium]|jgi:Ca-activated chloride channel family protein|nr:DnaJ domain-containing protein [Thermoflexia bacterium]